MQTKLYHGENAAGVYRDKSSAQEDGEEAVQIEPDHDGADANVCRDGRLTPEISAKGGEQD